MLLQGLVAYLPLLFILIGISFLAGTIFYMRNVNYPLSWSRINWRVVLLLTLFFCAGYLLHSHLLLVNGVSKTLVVVSVVLLIASITLFISVRQNKQYAGLLRLSDLEKENQEIRNMHQRLEIILDNAAESILTFNNRLKISGLNRAGERLFGYAENALIGHELSLLISNFPEDFRTKIDGMLGEEVEFIGKNHEGDRFPISLKVSAVNIDNQLVYIAIIADISDRKEVIERLQHLADRDGLTGLYNRRVFLQKVTEALDLVKRGGVSCALLFIDLDNFKAINDVYGHAGGDRFLVDVANLLQRDRRKSDYVARLGGDEFAVLMMNNYNNMALDAAKVFLDVLEEPIELSKESISVTAKVGITIYPEHGGDVQILLKHMDAAIIAAKRNNELIHVYEAEKDDTSGRLALVQSIKSAIEQSEFELYYQPKIELVSGTLIGVEALARWPDKNNGYIPTEMFISVMEQTGLI
ncbi:MAG: diguanylate cyclase, partial [Gammaproteobacteria bacterium]|nr:diguanylate cyclase [Gammaproteobacteria bacterium]